MDRPCTSKCFSVAPSGAIPRGPGTPANRIAPGGISAMKRRRPAKTSSRVYLDDFSQRMKMRRPHDVPLSRQALVVLREVWELSYGNGIEHGLTEAYPALAK